MAIEDRNGNCYYRKERGLRPELERLNPNLRTIGIGIKFLGKFDRGRLMKLEYRYKQPSEPSERPFYQGNDTDGLDLNCHFNRQPNIQPSANRQPTVSSLIITTAMV